MTLLAYAAVRDADPFRGPLPAGIGGEPLRLISDGEHAFVCSAAPPGEPDVPRLLAFADVARELHRLGTVLPLRFGGVGSEDSLRQALAARAAEFAADLARLDGLEEVTLRLTLPAAPDPAPAPTTGTAYLLARRRQFDRADALRATAEQVVATCRQVFAGALVDLAAEPPRADPPALAVHLLVPRGRFDEVAAAARAAGLPGELRVLGPWPAYHFFTPPAADTGALGIGNPI